jgi:hypothetical protein
MQTKSRIAEFLAAFFVLSYLIVIPAFAIGRLVDPPYNLLGWAIVLINAWRVVRRRERLEYSRWCLDRRRRASDHGLSR